MNVSILDDYCILTDDITTEDEGFNSRGEESIHSFTGNSETSNFSSISYVLRTDNSDDDISANTSTSDLSVTNTFTTSELNPLTEITDSFLSFESAKFFQYQNQIRKRFGGILEQQITRLKSNLDDLEFEPKKLYTEDSTQTYKDNEQFLSLDRCVSCMLTLIRGTIEENDGEDENWTKSLEEMHDRLHSLNEELKDLRDSDLPSDMKKQIYLLKQHEFCQMYLKLYMEPVSQSDTTVQTMDLVPAEQNDVTVASGGKPARTSDRHVKRHRLPTESKNHQGQSGTTPSKGIERSTDAYGETCNRDKDVNLRPYNIHNNIQYTTNYPAEIIEGTHKDGSRDKIRKVTVSNDIPRRGSKMTLKDHHQPVDTEKTTPSEERVSGPNKFIGSILGDKKQTITNNYMTIYRDTGIQDRGRKNLTTESRQNGPKKENTNGSVDKGVDNTIGNNTRISNSGVPHTHSNEDYKELQDKSLSGGKQDITNDTVTSIIQGKCEYNDIGHTEKQLQLVGNKNITPNKEIARIIVEPHTGGPLIDEKQQINNGDVISSTQQNGGNDDNVRAEDQLQPVKTEYSAPKIENKQTRDNQIITEEQAFGTVNNIANRETAGIEENTHIISSLIEEEYHITYNDEAVADAQLQPIGTTRKIKTTEIPEAGVNINDAEKADEFQSNHRSTEESTMKRISICIDIMNSPNHYKGLTSDLEPSINTKENIGFLDNEQMSDDDLSLTEVQRTLYKRKVSPRRKSLADELEQYFAEHPESPKLKHAVIILPGKSSDAPEQEDRLNDNSSPAAKITVISDEGIRQEIMKRVRCMKNLSFPYAIPTDDSKPESYCPLTIQKKVFPDVPYYNTNPSDDFTREGFRSEHGLNEDVQTPHSQHSDICLDSYFPSSLTYYTAQTHHSDSSSSMNYSDYSKEYLSQSLSGDDDNESLEYDNEGIGVSPTKYISTDNGTTVGTPNLNIAECFTKPFGKYFNTQSQTDWPLIPNIPVGTERRTQYFDDNGQSKLLCQNCGENITCEDMAYSLQKTRIAEKRSFDTRDPHIYDQSHRQKYGFVDYQQEINIAPESNVDEGAYSVGNFGTKHGDNQMTVTDEMVSATPHGGVLFGVTGTKDGFYQNYQIQPKTVSNYSDKETTEQTTSEQMAPTEGDHLVNDEIINDPYKSQDGASDVNMIEANMDKTKYRASSSKGKGPIHRYNENKDTVDSRITGKKTVKGVDQSIQSVDQKMNSKDRCVIDITDRTKKLPETEKEPVKWSSLSSRSDSNLFGRPLKSRYSILDSPVKLSKTLHPTGNLHKCSTLRKWISIGIVLLLFFVSQIRRTNGNGDIRDFSLLDDLSTLVSLHHYRPPPCF